MSPHPNAEAMDPDLFDARPPRTSVTAVLSLVCSLICCIPGMGLLGIILGGLGLMFISSSFGRLTGRPAAVLGIIVGLMSTVLWLALFMGGAQAFTFYKKQMAPAAVNLVTHMAAGDFDAARGGMTPAAAQEVSDERFTLFADAMRVNYGEPTGTPGTDWATLFESFGRMRSGANVQFDADTPPVPVTIEFTNTHAVAYVILDKDELTQGHAVAVDLLVYLPDDSVITLREDGPASDLAQYLLVTETPLEDAAAGKSSDGSSGDSAGEGESDESSSEGASNETPGTEQGDSPPF